MQKYKTGEEVLVDLEKIPDINLGDFGNPPYTKIKGEVKDFLDSDIDGQAHYYVKAHWPVYGTDTFYMYEDALSHCKAVTKKEINKSVSELNDWINEFA